MTAARAPRSSFCIFLVVLRDQSNNRAGWCDGPITVQQLLWQMGGQPLSSCKFYEQMMRYLCLPVIDGGASPLQRPNPSWQKSDDTIREWMFAIAT